MAANMSAMWGEKIVERGFTQVPNYLMMINQFLAEERRLTPVQLLVLLQLVYNWWEKDKPPFPSMQTMARRLGVSERQVQRAITDLEKKDIIKRVKRAQGNLRASNAYDMSGLVSILGEVAEAYLNAYPRRRRARVGLDDDMPF
jgi:hypothetical protein